MARGYLAGVKVAAQRPPTARRVLGIDPGTNLLGYAIVHQEGRRQRLLALGAHKTSGEEAAQKLRSVYAFLSDLIDLHAPTECALEAPFFGKNVQSMLKLGRAQGVAMAVAMAKGLTVAEYAPKKIKVSVTGNGNASKEQVAIMTSRLLRFSLEGIKLDATDAVATALCHLNQSAHAAPGRKSYSGWGAFLEDNPSRRM